MLAGFAADAVNDLFGFVQGAGGFAPVEFDGVNHLRVFYQMPNTVGRSG